MEPLPDTTVEKADYDLVLAALTYVIEEFDKPAGPSRNVAAAIRAAKDTLDNLHKED